MRVSLRPSFICHLCSLSARSGTYQYRLWKPIPLAFRPSLSLAATLTTNAAHSVYSSGAFVGYGVVGTDPTRNISFVIGYRDALLTSPS